MRRGSATPLQVGDEIHLVVEQLCPALPPGQVNYWSGNPCAYLLQRVATAAGDAGVSAAEDAPHGLASPATVAPLTRHPSSRSRLSSREPSFGRWHAPEPSAAEVDAGREYGAAPPTREGSEVESVGPTSCTGMSGVSWPVMRV